MKKNLEKKLIFGVCAGIADELQLDPTLVRAGFAILTLMGFGLPVIVYLILAIVMPSK